MGAMRGGRSELDGGMIPNLLYSGSDRSSFACDQCKRKKIRCDKVAPRCGHCSKQDRQCDYPAAVPKPGPKAGSIRRRRRRNSSSGKAAQQRSPSRNESDGSSDDAGYERTMIVIHPHQGGSDASHWDKQEPIAIPEGDPYEQALASLGLSEQQYQDNMSSFFANMTAFSLFHQPSFHQKVRSIPSWTQIRALLVAMTAFSHEFHPSGIKLPPSDASLWHMAYRLVRECLDTCEDGTPPLVVLQTLVLVTWQKVCRGVRGAAFRLVGECVRLGYEMRMNEELVPEMESLSFLEREERRRTWWACWELDVFASTMKRVPLAVEWSSNKALLPVSDDHWFANDEKAKSCQLHVDPNQRWKELQKSKNVSWTTWFILINSYALDGYLLSVRPNSPRERTDYNRTGASPSSAATFSPTEEAENIEKRRHVFINCLHCALMALPDVLSVQNRYLSFQPADRANDAGRYSIHLMSQVARFMLYRPDIFRSLPSRRRRYTHNSMQDPNADNSSTQTPDSVSSEPTSRTPQPPQRGSGQTSRSRANGLAWEHFLASAENCASLLRNCSGDHVRYVNPCLSNSLWFSASAAIVGRILGPPRAAADRAWMTSNLDIIWSVLRRFVSVWGVPGTLIDRFGTLEEYVAQLGAEDKIGRKQSDKVTEAAEGPDESEIQETDTERPHKKGRPNGIEGRYDAKATDQRVPMFEGPLASYAKHASGLNGTSPSSCASESAMTVSPVTYSAASSNPHLFGGESSSLSAMSHPCYHHHMFSNLPPRDGIMNMMQDGANSSSEAVQTGGMLTTTTPVPQEHQQQQQQHGGFGFAGGGPGAVASASSAVTGGMDPAVGIDFDSLRDADLNVLLGMSGDLGFDFDLFRCPFD